MSGVGGGTCPNMDPSTTRYDGCRGDLSRFLDDVEATGVKPRPPTPSHSVSSGGSRGGTPPPSHWDRSGSARSDSPSSKSANKSRSSGSQKLSNSGGPGDSSMNTSAEAISLLQTSSQDPGVTSPSESVLSSAKSLQKLSATSVASYGSSSKGKKKSWVSNALNPTYRSRCEDLRRNFPDLPSEEMLVVDYSCALQRDILVHGRLYVTTNFLCFYANIFRWETAVTIRWREVTELKKEKTALVIPNAIQVCAGVDKFFFTSFATRDKTYMMLFRLWQNALLDSPATQTEIWSWVQSVYGEQTSRYNSDDPDASNDGASNYSYDGMDVSNIQSPVLNLHRPRLCSNIQEDDEETKLPINKGSFLPERVGNQLICDQTRPSNVLRQFGDYGESYSSESKRNVTSPTLTSTSDILTYEVWRQTKEAREIISRNFAINIDDLCTLLFTNSKFFYDFQAERKTFDILQCPWQHSDKSEDKFREVSYTMALNHAIGPKTTRATEVQTMRSNSVPGHIYNVDVETTNADIPYADYFYVSTHYCILKVGEGESLLTVLCDIKYNKTPWGLVKSFIEKNCWAGIEEHYVALAGSLEKEIEVRVLEADPGVEGLKAKKLTRRMRNQRRSSVSEVSERGHPTAPPPLLLRKGTVRHQHHQVKMGIGGDQAIISVLVGLLSILCMLNIFLIYKIWSLEEKIAMPSLSMPRPSLPSSWLEALREQESSHHRDLKAWRTAVESATKLLQQTENTMGKLTQSFEEKSNWNLLKTLLQTEENHVKAVDLESFE